MPKNRKAKLPKYVLVKDGRWFVRRNFPTGDRVNGVKTYTQVVRICQPQTWEQAALVSSLIEAEYKTEAVDATVTTVGAFLESFLSAKRQSVESRTYDDYRSLYERYVLGTPFASLKLGDVSPMSVQSLYGALGASPEMTRKLNTFISMAFNQGMRWGTVVTNPCKGVILPQATYKETEILMPAEAKAFAQVCLYNDRFLVLMFALETSMRPEEYLALSWDAVDLNTGKVKIDRAVTFPRGGGFRYKSPKTAKSRRTISITDTLVEKLREHRQIQQDHLNTLRRDIAKPLLLAMKRKGYKYQLRKDTRANKKDRLELFEKHNLVFPSAKGTPLSPTSLGRFQMKEACKLAGIRPHSTYSLRHTSITLAILAGGDIKAISEKAGHAGIAITLSRYQHVLPSMHSDVNKRLSGMLY